MLSSSCSKVLSSSHRHATAAVASRPVAIVWRASTSTLSSWEPLSDDSALRRSFSSSSSGNSGKKPTNTTKTFRSRRRPPSNYRPVEARKIISPVWKNDPNKGFPVGNYKFEKPQDKVLSVGSPNADKDNNFHKEDIQALLEKNQDQYDPKTMEQLQKFLKEEDQWLDSTNHNPENYYDDTLEEEFGPLAGSIIREEWREKEFWNQHNNNKEEDATATMTTRTETMFDIESHLRMADYLTSEEGSTEDIVGGRKYLGMDIWNPKKRKQFLKDIETKIQQQQLKDLELHPTTKQPDDAPKDYAADGAKLDPNNVIDEDFDPALQINPNQLAHGPWGELIIRVDRVIKLWRGGRLESYRALIIGGNLNGCGGYGIGKAFDPIQAVEVASRHCKRNIFFVDRYQGNGLTRDLVGKQNSCRVTLRTTNNGLRGNPLCMEILKRFGITNCVSKSHGNRNQFNVVRATFKALMTHETLDEVALKRGKRLASLDRTKRLRI